MVDTEKIKYVYLIGIGGIGMSAIARYFNLKGLFVAGYDRTSTKLTSQLISEGIPVHFEDSVPLIPGEILKQKDETMIIYTPAVPVTHSELNYFNANSYCVLKRAEILGILTEPMKTIAIAGSHGKTTVTSLIAHIFTCSEIKCTAFLGGISKNYGSNLLTSDNSNYSIVEADEFDRSFLNLRPFASIITSIDADHLDIYGDKEELVRAFNLFAGKTRTNGLLLIKNTLTDLLVTKNDVKRLTYSLDSDSDYYADNILLENGLYRFDIVMPGRIIRNIKLGIPGIINVENAVAAVAMCTLCGIDEHVIVNALESYSGILRRFDYQINSPDLVYIDDYAHHPQEIKAFIGSLKIIYPQKKITGIFQPHLFSRTHDLADEFAQALGMLDELILLDIYPARELPVEGVTSQIIFDKVVIRNKILCSKNELFNIINNNQFEVLVTMGAGDIDSLVEPIRLMLMKKINNW